MNSDEQDKLELIHEDLRETREEMHRTRTRVEVVDERTQRIDAKTDKVDQRVFGPDGLESQVQKNRADINRLNSIGAIIVGSASAILAKVFDLFP